MKARGPKTLWRVSWSGGTKPYDEPDSQYYSLEDYAMTRVQAAIKAGAKVHLETTNCAWRVLLHDWKSKDSQDKTDSLLG